MLAKGSRHEGAWRILYLGAVLGPVLPQVAVQVTLKENTGAFEVPLQLEAPRMAWVTEMTGGVQIWVLTQSVVPAAMVTQVTAWVLSCAVCSRLKVMWGAGQ